MACHRKISSVKRRQNLQKNFQSATRHMIKIKRKAFIGDISSLQIVKGAYQKCGARQVAPTLLYDSSSALSRSA
ncbi:hypothetical protein ACSS6W_011064 [Trichoderma asperelloides]